MPQPYAYDRSVSVPPAVGWSVLALVFLDELLALTALGVWGADVGGWPLAVLLVAAGVTVWYLFASPKAPYGGPTVRPIAKVLVFGAGAGGLYLTGHEAWAIALLVFSVLVDLAARHPDIRDLANPAG